MCVTNSGATTRVWIIEARRCLDLTVARHGGRGTNDIAVYCPLLDTSFEIITDGNIRKTGIL